MLSSGSFSESVVEQAGLAWLEGAGLVVRNRALHHLLVDCVTVECRDAEGGIRDTQTRLTPSARAMQAIEKLAPRLHEGIVQCARKSRTLTTVRDKLLPKLISGQLQVKGAGESLR